jgi:hypothetical protein
LSVTTATFDDSATVSVDELSGAILNLNFTGEDRVAAFEIDGTPQADGIYGAIDSGAPNETSAITGSGLLYVNTDLPGSTSSYASWVYTNGLTAGVNDESNDDPDNDGVSNILEFVFGGNPLGTDSSVLPDPTMTSTDFVFTFSRNDDSESEVMLTFQHGDMVSWTDVAIGADNASSGPEVNIIEDGANPDTITVTIPMGANTKLFGRLQAVK